MDHQINTSQRILKLHQISITRSGVLTSKHQCIASDGSLPYIRPMDIKFNTIVRSEEQVSEEVIRKAQIEITKSGSILIANSGPNAGNIALLKRNAVVNQNVFYITIQIPLVKPKFLYYYLFFKRHLLINVSKYSLHVSNRFLQNLDVPIPAIKQQQQIVQHLDKQLTGLNTSISRVKRAIGEIHQAKQHLLNKIFPLKPGDDLFSESYILKLKDCGIVQAGKTPNGSIKNYYGSDYPLFKPSDLGPEMHLKNAGTYLSYRGVKEARYVKANSLLICSSGVNLGKVGITQVDGACSQQMISLMPNDKFIPEFIYFQMNSDSFRHQLLKQSTNYLVKKSAFVNLSLRVANLRIQKEILDKLQLEIELLENKESSYNKELCYLDGAKSNLLLRSFSPHKVFDVTGL